MQKIYASIFIFLSAPLFAIINGKIESDNFSYVVPIGKLSTDKSRFIFFCSGVLIAPDAILTIKSCTDKILESSKKISIPENKTCPNYFGASQEKIVKHLSVKEDPKIIKNDLSLLFLEEVMPSQPAIFPDQSVFENLKVTSKINIAGFGQAIHASAFSDLDPIRTSTYCTKRSGLTRFMGFETSEETITILSGISNGAFAYLGDEGGGVFLNINSATQSVRHLIGILNNNPKIRNEASKAFFLEKYIATIEDALRTACDKNERTSCEQKGLLFSSVSKKSHLLTRENEPAKLPRFNINKNKKQDEPKKKKSIKTLHLKNLGCNCQST